MGDDLVRWWNISDDALFEVLERVEADEITAAEAIASLEEVAGEWTLPKGLTRAD